MHRWLHDPLRYAHTKLLPPGAWRQARDGRKKPEILPGTLWLTAWAGFLLQLPSLEQSERLARRRRWEKSRRPAELVADAEALREASASDEWPLGGSTRASGG